MILLLKSLYQGLSLSYSLLSLSVGHLKMISAWFESRYIDKTLKYVECALDTLLSTLKASFIKLLECFLNSLSQEQNAKAGWNVKQEIWYCKTDHNGCILRKHPKPNWISASAECSYALLFISIEMYILKGT